MRWKRYYYLVKPGIIYGNALTTLAGFLFACRWHIDVGLLLATLVGTSLVIGGACVYNNCLDRDLDRRMKRTQKRALVTGAISLRSALIFATVLTLLGFGLLLLAVNTTVVLIGVIGFIDYVLLYDLVKRLVPAGTLVGSISGSMPVMAGYCAVTGHFDTVALLLFLILTAWQMPHFYAIALYRRDDYAAAGVPVLTRKRSSRTVRLRCLLYMVAFLVACLLLSLRSRAGYSFAVLMGLLSLTWLWQGLKGFTTEDDVSWGKRLFGYSLVVILGFSAVLSVGSLLP